jgi:hypothetical protein
MKAPAKRSHTRRREGPILNGRPIATYPHKLISPHHKSLSRAQTTRAPKTKAKTNQNQGKSGERKNISFSFRRSFRFLPHHHCSETEYAVPSHAGRALIPSASPPPPPPPRRRRIRTGSRSAARRPALTSGPTARAPSLLPPVLLCPRLPAPPSPSRGGRAGVEGTARVSATPASPPLRGFVLACSLPRLSARSRRPRFRFFALGIGSCSCFGSAVGGSSRPRFARFPGERRRSACGSAAALGGPASPRGFQASIRPICPAPRSQRRGL